MRSVVPFSGVGAGMRQQQALFHSALDEVLTAGQFIGGDFVERFENEFAGVCGTRYAVGVGNGLDALRLTLEAAGIGRGDEVLVPGFTFVATLLAVVQAGATPVGVDVDAATGLMDAEHAKRAIGRKTKAIVVVDLFGNTPDLGEFARIARDHSILLIQDAAQCHGGTFQGEPLARFGVASTFSFYPTKNLGALGDGGIVVTDDQALALSLRSLRSYGSGASKYEHSIPGWNSRLDALQAAFLLKTLPQLDDWNRRRRLVAGRYREALNGAESVSELDPSRPIDASVWHHFVVRCEDRAETIRALEDAGVGVDIHYPTPAYASSAMQGVRGMGPESRGALPNSDHLAEAVLSLPMHPWLTEGEIDYCCEALSGL